MIICRSYRNLSWLRIVKVTKNHLCGHLSRGQGYLTIIRDISWFLLGNLLEIYTDHCSWSWPVFGWRRANSVSQSHSPFRKSEFWSPLVHCIALHKVTLSNCVETPAKRLDVKNVTSPLIMCLTCLTLVRPWWSHFSSDWIWSCIEITPGWVRWQDFLREPIRFCQVYHTTIIRDPSIPWLHGISAPRWWHRRIGVNKSHNFIYA